eukprot:TRINITY_DN11035_c0_g1_i1.p1 TRINITY_DN11035_c0_g1~~TRINITY_DN11035_c0_g1_i1.p1  ORF type:complete len:240 (+),score=-11.78 TRINITY_DN11035_c0_g1_i1:207-926(+)
MVFYLYTTYIQLLTILQQYPLYDKQSLSQQFISVKIMLGGCININQGTCFTYHQLQQKRRITLSLLSIEKSQSFTQQTQKYSYNGKKKQKKELVKKLVLNVLMHVLDLFQFYKLKIYTLNTNEIVLLSSIIYWESEMSKIPIFPLAGRFPIFDFFRFFQTCSLEKLRADRFPTFSDNALYVEFSSEVFHEHIFIPNFHHCCADCNAIVIPLWMSSLKVTKTRSINKKEILYILTNQQQY